MATSNEDILFTNVTIIDGSGTQERYIGHVQIHNGFIKSITPSTPPQDPSIQPPPPPPTTPSTRIIDGHKGTYTLSPGFIDMHAHSDLSVLHTPAHLAKITQGVTTEVIGQDGISYAPVNDSILPRIRAQIAGWNGNPSAPPDFWTRWRSVAEYLEILDDERTATNLAFLVPQGNLRALVLGWEGRKARGEEVEEMKRLLAVAMEEGAVGLSSGLTYVPGMFADDEELAGLCRVVKRYNGYYCPHHRSYGKNAMKAYAEMIDLARQTGVRLHLTHATLNFDENRGRAGELLAMIDAAIAEGLDISLDTYPYLPGSTTLAATLPSWVAAAHNKRELLSDPATLARIRHQALAEGTDGCHGVTLDFSTIEVSGVGDASLAERYVGKTIDQIAAAETTEPSPEPFEVYVEILLADDFRSTILQHVGDEGNVRAIMRHSRHTGGSDGILTSTKPHPRGWGTFPRYVGHYGRDLARGKTRDIYRSAEREEQEGEGEEEEVSVPAEQIFAGGLEEAVAHLTSRAAGVMGLRDRGLVRPGFRADLVLFDAENIRDCATFALPQRPAMGIRTVLVNGVLAVDEGRPTMARNGRTIRLRRDGKGGFKVR